MKKQIFTLSLVVAGAAVAVASAIGASDTAVVRGVDDMTGVALVEVYALNRNL